ncbi:MAG: MmcQ/YjbR family DNA-binding protein, partial [Bacteroidales bacterium]
MNVEELRDFVLTLPHVEESFPFNETTLVMKVVDKMFLLFDIESKPLVINVKCDPDMALELRELYSFVVPGYHMNKRHWNSVEITDGVSDRLIRTWIKDSYLLVVAGLKKEQRE